MFVYVVKLYVDKTINTAAFVDKSLMFQIKLVESGDQMYSEIFNSAKFHMKLAFVENETAGDTLHEADCL